VLHNTVIALLTRDITIGLLRIVYWFFSPDQRIERETMVEVAGTINQLATNLYIGKMLLGD